jgi:hypothetical protein
MAKKKLPPVVTSARSVEALMSVVQSGNETINNNLEVNLTGVQAELKGIHSSILDFATLFSKVEKEEANIEKKEDKSADLSGTLIDIKGVLSDIYTINSETLSVLKGDAIKKEEDRREKNREEGAAPEPVVTKSEKSKSKFSLGGLGGILGGIAAVGIGLGGFFMGMAGAEAIMSKFGNGSNLKSMLVNLAEGLSAFDNQGLIAMGALLGTGMLFGAVGGIGKAIGGGLGMAAVGLGLGGFFGGLAIGDATASFFNADGTFIKNQMVNLAEGLKAFDDRGLYALGGLLAGGMLFGAVTGMRTKGRAVLGMGAIGLGIGGFLSALTLGGAFSIGDGSNVKSLLTNLAEGLNAFSGESMIAFGSLLGVGALFGFVPGAKGAAITGMTAIGLGIAGFIGAFASVTELLGVFGVDGSNMKKMLVNLATGLNAFNDVDASNVLKLVPAIAALGPAMMLFLGSNGIAGIASAIGDTVKSAWNWMFGGDDAKPEKTIVHKIIDMLKPFETMDASKYDAIGKVGDFLGNFIKSVGNFASVDSNMIHDKMRKIGEALQVNAPKIELAIAGGVTYDDKGREIKIKGLASSDIEYNVAVQRITQLQAALSGPAAIDVSPQPTTSGGVTGGLVSNASNYINNKIEGAKNYINSSPTNVNSSTTVNNSSQTIVPISASRIQSSASEAMAKYGGRFR